MLKYAKWIVLSSLLCVPLTAAADMNVAKAYIPSAQEVGSGRLNFLFWDVYDATLYAPNGTWDAEQPYALSLAYLMELEGKDIAERSVEEMRNQGFTDEVKLASWYQQMEAIFPNVDETTTLTGIHDQNGYAVFYRNDTRIGIIQDTEFTDRFFAIWLSQDTAAPDLRDKLLGLAQ